MKKDKKCSTCIGFGLWGIGNPSPMGAMDSTEMPSIKCPECGAVGKIEMKQEQGSTTNDVILKTKDTNWVKDFNLAADVSGMSPLDRAVCIGFIKKHIMANMPQLK